MGFALPQRWEYLSTGSLKLPNESIGDGQTILPSLAALLHIEIQGIAVAAWKPKIASESFFPLIKSDKRPVIRTARCC